MRKKERPVRKIAQGHPPPDMAGNEVDVSQNPMVQEEGFNEGEQYSIDRFYPKSVTFPFLKFNGLRQILRTSVGVLDRQLYKNYFAKPFVFQPEAIKSIVNNFSIRNKIGETQFGEVFQGVMRAGPARHRVTVKKWNENANCLKDSQGPHIFVMDEVVFLRDPLVSTHNNVANVIGYCDEDDVIATVYDFGAMDSLHNMITKDIFGWTKRIEVALRFALLLNYLHNLDKPYIIKNISPLHIMLDYELNPILLELGCVSGGVIGDLNVMEKMIWNSPGYRDWSTPPDIASPKSDVYAFGVILLGMLNKRVSGPTNKGLGMSIDAAVADWARRMFNNNQSLVHKSMLMEPYYDALDALVLTQLGMRCIEARVTERPTMKEVVECMMNLKVYSD